MDILISFHKDGIIHLGEHFNRCEPENFVSLSDAIDAANAMLELNGGSIEFSSGRFELQRPICIGAGVHIRGQGGGTVLAAGADFIDEPLVLVAGASRSSVTNLSLEGAGVASEGLVLSDCVDCAVRDCTAIGFTGSGIVLRNNCSCCTVIGCSVTECCRSGFLFENQAFHGRIGNFPPNTVTACTTIGGGHGFEVFKTTVFNLTSCSAFQPRGHGFYLHETSNSVLISGCRTFQCELSAVYVRNAHELNISSSIFCWQRGDGIVLDLVNWAAINANEIIDSGVRDLEGIGRTAVVMKNGTKGVQLCGNTIFNWGDQPPMAHAVEESEDCSENLIAHNHVNYLTGEAFVSRGAGSIVRDNLVVAEAAYRNMDKPPFADFDRSQIEAYARDLQMEARVTEATVRAGRPNAGKFSSATA